MIKKLFFLYELPLPSVKYDDFVVVCLNDGVCDALNKRKISFKTKNDYKIKKYDMPKEAFFFFNKIGATLVYGKALRDIFTYDNFCLWDNIQYNFCSYLYEHRHARLPTIDIIKEVIETEKPDVIFLQSAKSLYGRAVVDVAGTFGLEIKTISGINKDLYMTINDNLRHRTAFLIKRFKRSLRRTKLKKELGKKYDIVVPLLMPSFVSIAKSVILELEKSGFRVLCISVEESVHEKMHDLLKKENFSYNFIESYIDNRVVDKVNDSFRYFIREWKRISSKKDFWDGLYYHDINVKNTLETIFDFYFRKRKRILDVLFYYFAFMRVLELERPKILMTLSESSDTTRPMLWYARKIGIKSVFLQHGVVKDTSVYGELIVDALAVWGDESKKEYVNRGIDPNKIFVVGMPKLDYIKNVKGNRAKICEEIGMDALGDIFLYLTQPHEKTTNEKITRMIFEAVKDYDANIVLKLHPREVSDDFYQSIAREFKIKIFCTHYNLLELISISDVVFGSTSSAGLEVLAIGKPLIIVSLSEQKSRNIYADKNAVLVASKAGEIKNHVISLKNKKTLKALEKNAREFLKESVYKVDGRASTRVVDLIRKIV